MAFGLENLSDTQRKALLIGVPAVALVAVGVRFGKGATPTPTTGTDSAPASTAEPATGFIPAANTDAIGVGQLTDFESQLTDAYQRLADSLHQQTQTTTPTATTPAPGQWVCIDAAGNRTLVPIGANPKTYCPGAKVLCRDGVCLSQADFDAIGRL